MLQNSDDELLDGPPLLDPHPITEDVEAVETPKPARIPDSGSATDTSRPFWGWLGRWYPVISLILAALAIAVGVVTCGITQTPKPEPTKLVNEVNPPPASPPPAAVQVDYSITEGESTTIIVLTGSPSIVDGEGGDDEPPPDPRPQPASVNVAKPAQDCDDARARVNHAMTHHGIRCAKALRVRFDEKGEIIVKGAQADALEALSDVFARLPSARNCSFETTCNDN